MIYRSTPAYTRPNIATIDPSPTIADILLKKHQRSKEVLQREGIADNNEMNKAIGYTPETSDYEDTDYEDEGQQSDSDDPSSNDDLSDSDDEVSDSNDNCEEGIKSGPRDNAWKYEKTFETRDALNEFLYNESWWSFRGSNDCSRGSKSLYRCNRVKRLSKVQCKAAIYIIEKTDFQNPSGGSDDIRTSFMLFRRNDIHTHKKSPDYVRRITRKVKELIIQQYKNGRKPKKILFMILDDADIPLKEKPSYKQIIHVIDNFKRHGSGAKLFSMRQLTKFVTKHMKVPKSQDEAFIVNFERSPKQQKNAKFFRYFISTKRLLNFASMAKIIHADATHKVTTEKITLIAVGVTDYNNKFHLSGLSVASNESSDSFALAFNGLKWGVKVVNKVKLESEYLVCDGDAAIHNGFSLAFGQETEDENHRQFSIIMCYFHVLLNIQKKYKFIIAKNRMEFKADVQTLHLCNSEKKFDRGCKLFVNKWKASEPGATKVIRKSFFKKHKNWFIGCAARVPKHNNGLESFNSTMKRCQTEHRRQPLKQFLSTALTIVRQRSKEYILDKPSFANELEISNEMMKRGLQLNLKFVHKPENELGNTEFFAFRSDIDKTITLEDVKLYEKWSYNKFNGFKSHYCDMWKITFPKLSNEWKDAVCNCPSFDRSFICKHIISIASTLGFLSETEKYIESDDYNDEPIYKSSRGRPK